MNANNLLNLGFFLMSTPLNTNRPIASNVLIVDRERTRDPLLRIRLPNSLKRQREIEAQNESSSKTQVVSTKTLRLPNSSSRSQISPSNQSVRWDALLQVTAKELEELSSKSSPQPQIEHPFTQPFEKNWIFRAYHPAITSSSSSTSSIPLEAQDWIFVEYNPSDEMKKSPESLGSNCKAKDIFHRDNRDTNAQKKYGQ